MSFSCCGCRRLLPAPVLSMGSLSTIEYYRAARIHPVLLGLLRPLVETAPLGPHTYEEQECSVLQPGPTFLRCLGWETKCGKRRRHLDGGLGKGPQGMCRSSTHTSSMWPRIRALFRRRLDLFVSWLLATALIRACVHGSLKGSSWQYCLQGARPDVVQLARVKAF